MHVLRAKATIIIEVIVLVILFTIIGFIIRLLAPIFVGIIILIIILVGGAWLYTNLVYVSSSRCRYAPTYGAFSNEVMTQ
jgi:hypothetical protein